MYQFVLDLVDIATTLLLSRVILIFIVILWTRRNFILQLIIFAFLSRFCFINLMDLVLLKRLTYFIVVSRLLFFASIRIFIVVILKVMKNWLNSFCHMINCAYLRERRLTSLQLRLVEYFIAWKNNIRGHLGHVFLQFRTHLLFFQF